MASGFILWAMSLLGSAAALAKARGFWRHARPVPAILCLAAAVALFVHSDRPAAPSVAASFVPADAPNSPIGVAVGVKPGRVVWIHNPNATNWDGVTGYSWDYCNQAVVDQMLSNSLRWLTGSSTDAQAWDALFRNLNTRRGRGSVGYVAGEKIAIKANWLNHGTAGRDTSYMVLEAMLDQLIANAHVNVADVTIYDASRYLNPDYIAALTANGTRYAGLHLVDNRGQTAGTTLAQADPNVQVYYSNPAVANGGTIFLPTCVTEAAYLINMAIFKPHVNLGVTMGAKNHFGSVCRSGAWDPSFMHSTVYFPQYGQYNALVDLMGHAHLGGKTLLYFLDALYSPVTDQTGQPARWLSDPFNNGWSSSILVSQDPVAIESVGVDILRAENAVQPIAVLTGDVDNYLHEAALAASPPSGTLYNSNVASPTTSFGSLGVHEHWNSNKLYTRNLGTGNGIELIRQAPLPPAPSADFNGDGRVDGKDFLIWQLHFPMSSGATHAMGDADYNGTVDGKDFMYWQQQYTPLR